MNERTIFLTALEIEDAVRRAEYIDGACGAEAALRQRVHDLLLVHAKVGGFLEQPAVGPESEAHSEGAIAAPTAAEALGTQIGPYKLLQKLGEGGMGTVFMAEQEAPVRRRVALKIIKAGMDSAHVSARFEQERQALAVMDHPNIAKVLDAGTTLNGLPYFVMELVKGIPITKYCDQEHLTTQERLELFVPVCLAVQHAHQKGIIHRDLKPSNVIIALYDGKPVPKVIDFGVAKAISQKLTEKTMFTEVGQMIGTLEYMAPEQAELNNVDIDTRVDIYSLGVILYELLTGTPPFTSKQLRSAAFGEMLRIIREVEPPKPSTKLSSSEELPAIAFQRKLEPKHLTRLVRGDLDWIVMKALAKDRSRRYATPAGFAEDIERYLADEPVLAGPPSAGYRVRKFVRRNRGRVLAASLVVLAMVGGVIGSTIGFLRADKAANAERQAKVTAQNRLAQIEKGYEILNSIFANLDPRAQGKSSRPLRLLLGEQLDRAAVQLESEAMGDPLAVAKLQETLGLSQLNLAYEAKALVLLTKARQTMEFLLGPDDPQVLTCMNNQALAYQHTGHLNQAIELFERTLAKSRGELGPTIPSPSRAPWAWPGPTRPPVNWTRPCRCSSRRWPNGRSCSGPTTARS